MPGSTEGRDQAVGIQPSEVDAGRAVKLPHHTIEDGDFKDGVLKVNIPRGDLRVTINQTPAPTPFGFGGWIALTKGSGGAEVLMGDLVLTEDEVNPVMSALLTNGLDVTALHNHFFWEQPRIFYNGTMPCHRARGQAIVSRNALSSSASTS